MGLTSVKTRHWIQTWIAVNVSAVLAWGNRLASEALLPLHEAMISSYCNRTAAAHRCPMIVRV